jgi:hypothetical protein
MPVARDRHGYADCAARLIGSGDSVKTDVELVGQFRRTALPGVCDTDSGCGQSERSHLRNDFMAAEDRNGTEDRGAVPAEAFGRLPS